MRWIRSLDNFGQKEPFELFFRLCKPCRGLFFRLMRDNVLTTWLAGTSRFPKPKYSKHTSKKANRSKEKKAVSQKPSPLWNVPYGRNKFFTERDDALHLLHQELQIR